MALDALAIAEVAYEAYLGYCAAQELSATAWADISESVQDEMEAQVEAIIADPTLTAREVHQQWLETRLAADWVYGLTYDPDAKTSPRLVDFYAMPLQSQTRWGILVATTNEMAQYEGFA